MSGAALECPVCFHVLNQDRGTEATTWPCGHVICRTCDAAMQRVNDLRCPTCRTPRAGVTRAQAEAAARANYEDSYMPQTMHVLAARRGPSHVIFFPSEHTASTPFDVIDRVATHVGHGLNYRTYGDDVNEAVSDEDMRQVRTEVSALLLENTTAINNLQNHTRVHALVQELIALRPDLHTVLRARGLIAAGDPTRDPAA